MPSQWRVPKALSPSALSKWMENREQYFLQYLATNRPPRFIQTQPMSVGSAFDAYVKCYIDHICLGRKTDFDELFVRQVEVQNRDFAMKAGADCFTQYRESGALMDLMKLIQKGDGPPRTEFDETKTIDDVNFNSKPDLRFDIKSLPVVLEFKVNGYCSANGAQPVSGYKWVYHKGNKKQSPAFDGWWHEDSVEINIHPNVEKSKPDWGRQLATYGWMGDIPVGGQMLVAVEQLACQGDGTIKFAHHLCEVTKEFQEATFYKYKNLWEIVNSDHIFRDLSKDESIAKCEQLNQQAAAFSGETDEDTWYRRIMKRGL